ncbi:MAG TPA: hypothetical protein PLK36_10980 [Methanoregulaceae archaeon]|nr:hypothetical protein [Methanoregulaceae archaeon]
MAYVFDLKGHLSSCSELFLRGYPLAGPGGRLSSHQGILMTSRKELVNEAVLW